MSPIVTARFSGQVAIVTGGASGIGRAVAGRLAGEGATVVIADIDEAAAQAVVDEIAARGQTAAGVPTDVTDAGSVSSLVNHTVKDLGRIDVLVSNAITRPADHLADMTIDDWYRDLEIGLTAPYLCTRTALPVFAAQRSGSIVYVSSVNALTFLGRDAYSVAKAGLLSLTRSVASRYGPSGIRANAVLPATVVTPVWGNRLDTICETAKRPLDEWYPLRRLGQPGDVAAAVAFLASADAAWITGVALPVDGGLLAGNQQLAETLQPPDEPAGGEEDRN